MNRYCRRFIRFGMRLWTNWDFLGRQLSEANIVMVDVNERALALAKQNAQRNHVENVEIIESDRFANLDGRLFAA